MCAVPFEHPEWPHAQPSAAQLGTRGLAAVAGCARGRESSAVIRRWRAGVGVRRHVRDAHLWRDIVVRGVAADGGRRCNRRRHGLRWCHRRRRGRRG
eukprot:7385974-Prymnesium_polylepis.4